MSSKAQKQRTSRAITNRNRRSAFLFLLPNIIGFSIFTFVPAVAAIFLSFTNWDGTKGFDIIGPENYINLFSDTSFMISVKNTVIYTVGTVPFIIVLALIMAFLINSGIKFANGIRALHFFPHISSIVAISVVWQFLYAKNGPINQFLKFLGVQDSPAWLSDKDWALFAVMIMIIWKGIGYYMIIYLAGLKNIDQSLYEAAAIDGANKFNSFRYVTIPQLRPITFLVTVMCIINSFQVFTPIMIMTGGGPGRATSVMVLKIYQDAFVNYKFGYASAQAVILFIFILAFTLMQNRIQNKE